LVYAKLILHYQHKIRNYQPKWKKQKSRKRSRTGEVARSKVTRKRAQEGRNSIETNNHPMPMNILMDTVFVWARRVQKCT